MYTKLKRIVFMGEWSLAPHILNLYTRWRRVNFMPRPLYHKCNILFPLTRGWVAFTVGLDTMKKR
jgi:hypothetical protein